MNAIIPDNNFRKRDPRLANQKKYQPKGHGKFPLAQFAYDEKNDQFICPAGKTPHFLCQINHGEGEK